MLNKIKENISVFIAITGVILGIISMSFYRISPTIQLLSVGFALFFSCFLFLVLFRRNIGEFAHKSNTKEKRILDIVFLVLFNVSIIILHYSTDRPLVFFILFSLCAGIVALSIYLSDTRIDYFFQFIKVVFLSFNIKYSIYMSAGYIPGVDPYLHAKMNELLAHAGTTSVLIDKELYFPMMHIQTAIMQVVTQLTIKDSTNFSIIVPYIFATSFIYLVGRSLFGDKVGLLAMLIVNISDFHIYWGVAPQTTSYGVTLFYFSMYLLYKVINSPSRKIWTLLSLFLILTLLFSHAVSSFILMVSIFSLALGSWLYNILYKNEKTFYHGLFLITAIALIQHWSMTIYKAGTSFFDQIVSNLYFYVVGYADFLNRPESATKLLGVLPSFTERLADSLGLSLLLFFAILGILIVLMPKHRCHVVFNYFIVLLFLFGITFAFPLFGLKNIIPTRWFAFEYFFVSIFAAFSILKISYSFDKILLKKAFVLLFISTMAFFMATNSISNLDSPLWLRESTVSTVYTPAEIQGASTMHLYSDEIFSDSRYGHSVINIRLGDSLSTEPSFQQSKIFLWRNYMLERPIMKYASLEGYDRKVQSSVIYGYKTLKELEQMDKIYDNGEIIAFDEGRFTFDKIL